LVDHVGVADVDDRLESALAQVALFSRRDLWLGWEGRRLLGLFLHHLVLTTALNLLASRALHDIDLACLYVGVLLRSDARAVVFFISEKLSASDSCLNKKVQ